MLISSSAVPYSAEARVGLPECPVGSDIHDNAASRELLISTEGRKKIGEAIKKELAAWLKEKKIR